VHKWDRRQFLQQTGGLGLAWWSSARLYAASEKLPNPVGYAAISWPESQFDQALKTISALGYQGLQMLGWVERKYAGPKSAELRRHLDELKLQPVALSCSGVKLDPAQPSEVTARFREYGEFFKRLGGRYLQVTDGGSPQKNYSSAQIASLARQMNEWGKLAQDLGLELGYHPHFGTLGETREGAARVLDSTDPRYVKLIADVAHLTLGGADPAEVIRTYRERLIFTHFKDLRKDIAVVAGRDRAAARDREYRFCEIGTGVVNFPSIVKAFRDTNFRGWVIVELDAYKPPAGGPSGSAKTNKDALEKLGFRF
jgi:inosose dehydratase